MSRPDTWTVGLPLKHAIYASPQGGVGCCLHIALDDGNIDDSNLDFCVTFATERGHPDCLALATLMRRMSRTQRAKLARAPNVL